MSIMGAFLEKAADVNLGVVVFGGLMGGLLQPIYARLHPDKPNPPAGHFLWCALLGIAAAGISVYVVANSKDEDPVRLLFFSVLCGLAFPSVLTSAVDSVGKHTKEVQQDIAQIAQQARNPDITETTNAADQLKSTLARNPLETIGLRGAPAVEATAQIAVQYIAETAATNPETTNTIINQLKQVEAVARTAGYSETAKTAAEESAKLAI